MMTATTMKATSEIWDLFIVYAPPTDTAVTLASYDIVRRAISPLVRVPQNARLRPNKAVIEAWEQKVS
jgi:hypothetical protein